MSPALQGFRSTSPALSEMEIPRPLMVITLKLHLFHISHLILNVKRYLSHLSLEFSTPIPSKIGKFVVKCEIEMTAAPTHLISFWTQI